MAYDKVQVDVIKEKVIKPVVSVDSYGTLYINRTLMEQAQFVSMAGNVIANSVYVFYDKERDKIKLMGCEIREKDGVPFSWKYYDGRPNDIKAGIIHLQGFLLRNNYGIPDKGTPMDYVIENYQVINISLRKLKKNLEVNQGNYEKVVGL